MIDSGRSAEVINDARHSNANHPKEKIEIDEPRFKSRLYRNHVRFQQRKYHYEKNAGEHVRNQFCHILKIIQSNTIDVNSLKNQCHFLQSTLVIPNEVRTTQKASVVAMLAWI